MSEERLQRTGRVVGLQHLEKRPLVLLEHPETREVTAHRIYGGASLKFRIASMRGEIHTFEFDRRGMIRTEVAS